MRMIRIHKFAPTCHSERSPGRSEESSTTNVELDFSILRSCSDSYCGGRVTTLRFACLPVGRFEMTMVFVYSYRFFIKQKRETAPN